MAVQKTDAPATAQTSGSGAFPPDIPNAAESHSFVTPPNSPADPSPLVFTKAESSSKTGTSADPAGPSAELLPEDLTDSLARLEMNSIQVRLYLDAIEEKITRMEPRIEELRSTQLPPEVAAPAPVEQPSTTAADLSVDPAHQPPNPAPTPFVERRRRSEKPLQERRRPSLATPEPPSSRQPWALPHSLLTRRKAFAAAVVACVAVLTLLLVSIGRRAPSGLAPSVESGHLPGQAKSVPSQTPPSQTLPFQTPPFQTLPKSSAAVHPGQEAPSTLQYPAPSDTVAPGGRPAKPSESATAPNGANAVSSAPVEVEPTSPNPVSAERAGHSHRAVAAAGALAGAGITHVSSGVMSGNLIYSRPPVYPKGLAHLFHVQGTVTMQAIISRTGRVQNLRIISGHHMLRGSARAAVMTWRYRPLYVNGSPVDVATIVSVDVHR